MTITVSVIIMLVAYIFGAITKLFIEKIPNKYIPIQNIIIGIISSFICFYMKLESNLLTAMIVCLISTMSAGGISDLIKIKNENGGN